MIAAHSLTSMLVILACSVASLRIIHDLLHDLLHGLLHDVLHDMSAMQVGMMKHTRQNVNTILIWQVDWV